MKPPTTFMALLAGVLVPVALAALALLLWFAYTAQAPGGSSAAPAAANGLTCTVRAGACVGSEVEVFRMSNTANAHAGTPAGAPTYTYRVCCEATGLGTDCSGTYDTVLALSAADNAHAATAPDGTYSTEVCLSVTEGSVDCTHGPDCGASECLATVSGATNAHVADCDGTADYATKVCCEASVSPCAEGFDTDGDSWYDEDEWAIGTDCEDDCPDNPTDDALPPDFNMDKTVNILDVLMYKPKLTGPYDARYDLNVDATVNILDVLLFKVELPKPWPCV